MVYVVFAFAAARIATTMCGHQLAVQATAGR